MNKKQPASRNKSFNTSFGYLTVVQFVYIFFPSVCPCLFYMCFFIFLFYLWSVLSFHFKLKKKKCSAVALFCCFLEAFPSAVFLKGLSFLSDTKYNK